MVYAQKLGCGGILDGGNDKVNYSETLGSKIGGQASRQQTLTESASKLYSQTKLIKAHDSTKDSPKLLPRNNDMNRLLDVYTPGVKRTFLQFGAIAVATDLRDPDGAELKEGDLQAKGGYSKSIEGMASQKLCAATKGKLRASGHNDGAAHNHLPFYVHKDITTLLGSLGECESLGRWSDWIKPQETNFQALCRLHMLYMVTVIDFLEDRFGPGAVKMVAFSDFVFKRGDQVHCESGVKTCEFMVPHRVGLKAVFGNTVVDSLVIS